MKRRLTYDAFGKISSRILEHKAKGNFSSIGACHTVTPQKKLVLLPHRLATCTPNSVLLAEVVLEIHKCLPWKRAQLVIDCYHLTWNFCVYIWKKATWNDIKTVFELAKHMPIVFHDIVLIAPKNTFRSWSNIVDFCKMILRSSDLRVVRHPCESQDCKHEESAHE